MENAVQTLHCTFTHYQEIQSHPSLDKGTHAFRHRPDNSREKDNIDSNYKYRATPRHHTGPPACLPEMPMCQCTQTDSSKLQLHLPAVAATLCSALLH